MPNSRTPLKQLPARRAPDLHRTSPTWARQNIGDSVQYRIYAPHPDGGAMASRITVPADTPRSVVAKRLRDAREFIWGPYREHARDAPSTAVETNLAPPAPRSEPQALETTQEAQPKPEPLPQEPTRLMDPLAEQASLF